MSIGGRFTEIILPDGDDVRVIKRGRSTPAESNDLFDSVGLAFHTGSLGEWVPTAGEILAAEAEFLRTHEHPRLVRLLDARLDAAPPEIALELIGGTNWRQAYGIGGVTVAHVMELARALAEIGPHGDIKPENLMLDLAGEIRILDPCAGLWQPPAAPQHMLYTPLYNPLARPSDVPALGVLLLEVVGGRHPLWEAHSEPIPGRLSPELAEQLDFASHLGHVDGADRLRRIWVPEPVVETDAGAVGIGLACLGMAQSGDALEVGPPMESAQQVADALAAL